MYFPGSPDIMFIAQPLNVTVQPINGVTRGAFSCSVFPDDDVQTITWYYYGQGLNITSVNIDDPNVMVGSKSGTSVLVLENVGMEQQGFYHCEVITSSDNLVGNSAYLTFDGEYATDFLIVNLQSSLGYDQSCRDFLKCGSNHPPSPSITNHK